MNEALGFLLAATPTILLFVWCWLVLAGSERADPRRRQ